MKSEDMLYCLSDLHKVLVIGHTHKSKQTRQQLNQLAEYEEQQRD